MSGSTGGTANTVSRRSAPASHSTKSGKRRDGNDSVLNASRLGMTTTKVIMSFI
jgi:hypothetical protein